MASKHPIQKNGGSGKEPAIPPEFSTQPLLALRRQMDHLFDDFLGDWRMPSLVRDLRTLEPFGTSFAFPTWRRDVVDVRFDMTETKDALKVTAELPGLDEEDVELVVADGVLSLKGEKKSESEEKQENYYVAERHYGAFERSFRLPESVDESKITASFNKGVLEITLPKRPEAKKAQKKIKISKA